MSFENLDDYLNTQAENGYQENIAQQGVRMDELAQWRELGKAMLEMFSLDENGKVTGFWHDMDSQATVDSLVNLIAHPQGDKLARIRILASNVDKDGTDLWQRIKDILAVTWE